MNIDSINVSLRERFEKPLPDCYVRRIIFWNDPKEEFTSMIDEVNVPNVKVLKLTGNNWFSAKMLLLDTDTESDYLVYCPICYDKKEDNWLYDIERYSEEFRADLVSMQMNEMNMQESTPLRRAMKQYVKFFESKERAAKLNALGTDYESPDQLHIDIMAVLTKAKSNTFYGVIRHILSESIYEDDDVILENIQKFGSMEVLTDMVSRYTGYSSEKLSLKELASHILITALSVGVDDKILVGLDNYISKECSSFCFALIDDWAASEDRRSLIELAEDVQEKYNMTKRFVKSEVEPILPVDCLPCIDEFIIGRYFKEISEDVIKADDIITAVESRRTSRWYPEYKEYYEGLFYIAKMRKFYLEHSEGFHYGEYNDIWKRYISDYYQMDGYYREFHITFRKRLKSSAGELDDLFKTVAEKAENLYKNWYLNELGSQWSKLICEDMRNEGYLSMLPQQTDFYKDNVKPLIKNSGRVFVIISDAFRFDVAAVLTQRLIQETNGNAEITAMQSVFPSETKYGMAALLPHDTLKLTNELKVLCNDMPTDSTENRDAILKKECDSNCAVTYETLLAMKKDQRRELINGAETVYIYHNKIDAVGDKANTENQVFDACHEAVDELKDLVKMIVNSMSGSNIIITSDHGFLYSYMPLEESDKAENELKKSDILSLNRRSIITASENNPANLMQVSLKPLSSELMGAAPYENIRLKKQGGGMNYVHGGLSLQECCVPVITFKNIRSGSKNFVEIKKAGLSLFSQTRKISNNITSLVFLQTEAVSGKTIAAEYEIYFTNIAGRRITDIQSVIADRTSTEAPDRTYKVRFTLRGDDFDGSETYFLNIIDKESGETVEKHEFSIKIAFANEFDL